MIVLGVDPGLSGGLALVRLVGEGKPHLLNAIDVPTTGEGAKRRVDVGAVLEFLRSIYPIDHAFIERAQAMRDQGASSGFIYGRAVGHLEACVMGMGIPADFVEPAVWKKAHGLLKRRKEDSRQRAMLIFPGTQFLTLKKHHNRAEAALMGWYGAVVVLKGTNSGRLALDPPASAGLPAGG